MIIFPFTFFLAIALVIIAIILAYEADFYNNLIAIVCAIFAMTFVLNPYYLVVTSSGQTVTFSFQRVFFPSVIFNALVVFHMIIVFVMFMRMLSGYAKTLGTRVRKGYNV